jgi:hypothetical protein
MCSWITQRPQFRSLDTNNKIRNDERNIQRAVNINEQNGANLLKPILHSPAIQGQPLAVQPLAVQPHEANQTNPKLKKPICSWIYPLKLFISGVPVVGWQMHQQLLSFWFFFTRNSHGSHAMTKYLKQIDSLMSRSSVHPPGCGDVTHIAVLISIATAGKTLFTCMLAIMRL